MGRRSGKAGLRRSTGNTIRLPGGHPSLQKYQNYSYFITEARNMDRDQTKQFGDLMKYMPTADGFVEYSMNKKKRWELPRLIKNKLLNESDNDELLVCLGYIVYPINFYSQLFYDYELLFPYTVCSPYDNGSQRQRVWFPADASN